VHAEIVHISRDLMRPARELASQWNPQRKSYVSIHLGLHPDSPGRESATACTPSTSPIDQQVDRASFTGTESLCMTPPLPPLFCRVLRASLI
jgi:hypothetical protein